MFLFFVFCLKNRVKETDLVDIHGIRNLFLFKKMIDIVSMLREQSFEYYHMYILIYCEND